MLKLAIFATLLMLAYVGLDRYGTTQAATALTIGFGVVGTIILGILRDA